METKDVILRLREERGLTQSALAQEVFVTRQAVSRWETGETLPETQTLKLLSRLNLGIKPWTSCWTFWPSTCPTRTSPQNRPGSTFPSSSRSSAIGARAYNPGKHRAESSHSMEIPLSHCGGRSAPRKPPLPPANQFARLPLGTRALMCYTLIG